MAHLYKCEKYFAVLIFISFVFGIAFSISFLTAPAHPNEALAINPVWKHLRNEERDSSVHYNVKITHPDLSTARNNKHLKRVDRDEESKAISEKEYTAGYPLPDYDVHAFYYIWYGNPSYNGKYLHWNHQYLPHWNKKLAESWPTGFHLPPDDIGSNYFPELGTYSSADISVIEEHMKQLRTAGIGVISVSWYPPDQADEQGEPSDYIIPQLLDKAQMYQIKVCLHIEPYKGRSASTLKSNLKYIISNYGNHSAFYRQWYRDKNLPLFYIYDSYNVLREEWARIFTTEGDLSIRNTELDSIFIGLLVEMKHWHDLLYAGFDGFYTYFASDGFSYGSTSQNWKQLSQKAAASGLLFIPSVGPGYVDDRIRPWNKINTKLRNNGSYYEHCFKLAVEAGSAIISITSFNEWHEGTQIEKAVPKKSKLFQYEDYLPNKPDFYLLLTRKWVHKFRRYKTLRH